MTDSKNGGSRHDASQLFAILDDLAGITELQRQPINEVELDYCDPVPLPPALIDRTLESIRSMQAPEVTLDASQLYPILDDLAGITELQSQPINEVELDYCNPVPLPTALVDRTLESIRSMQAPEVEATPRRWWARPAAALPIAISVLLLAASPIYFFWWGRDSRTTLTCEQAIETVFDARQPNNHRFSAYGRVFSSIKAGISAIKRCALRHPGLRPHAEETFEAIRGMCDDPAGIDSIDPIASGHLEALLETIREEDSDSTRSAMIDALKEFTRSAEFGIDALFRGSGLGPRFRARYETQMGYVRERLKW